MSILLDVKNLGISFGGLRAVNEFDLTIQKEQLYGLIGPNGAGKTTVFNLLTGVYKPEKILPVNGILRSVKQGLRERFRISVFSSN